MYCVLLKYFFSPPYLLVLTVNGSDPLTGECTLTNVKPHSTLFSKRPPTHKNGEGETKFTKQLQHVFISKGHKHEGVINIAGFTKNKKVKIMRYK